jgi:prolyl-tRNA synthetase
MDRIADRVPEILEEIQTSLLERYRTLQADNTRDVDDYERFKEILDDAGGFLRGHWCGSGDCETRIKEETKATIRCIPLDAPEEAGACLACGEGSERRVIYARAY